MKNLGVSLDLRGSHERILFHTGFQDKEFRFIVIVQDTWPSMSGTSAGKPRHQLLISRQRPCSCVDPVLSRRSIDQEVCLAIAVDQYSSDRCVAWSSSPFQVNSAAQGIHHRDPPPRSRCYRRPSGLLCDPVFFKIQKGTNVSQLLDKGGKSPLIRSSLAGDASSSTLDRPLLNLEDMRGSIVFETREGSETRFTVEGCARVPTRSLYSHGMTCASSVDLDLSHVSSARQAERM